MIKYKDKQHSVVIEILVANLIPVFGILLLGWSVKSVITYLFLEGIIFFIFSVLKSFHPVLQKSTRATKKARKIAIVKFLIFVVILLAATGASLQAPHNGDTYLLPAIILLAVSELVNLFMFGKKENIARRNPTYLWKNAGNRLSNLSIIAFGFIMMVELDLSDTLLVASSVMFALKAMFELLTFMDKEKLESLNVFGMKITYDRISFIVFSILIVLYMMFSYPNV